MQVAANIVPFTKPVLRGANSDPQKEEPFWRELGQDIRDYILYFDHERIDDISRLFKDFGGALRGGWKAIQDIPRKVLNHPIIAERVDKDDRDFWSDLGGQIGLLAGFAAAGGHALAGGLKLSSAVKQKNLGRGLDGLVDIATGSSLALAVAGLAGARAIVAPLAATINMVRGGYNTVVGFQRHDQRKQLQGTLDLTRSGGSVGRILRKTSPAFKVAGVALAPIAGALQAGRGVHDIGTGLKNDDKRKQVKGLVDIATAVGTAMAFASGVAIIPGVALAVAANVLKAGYQLSPKLRKKVDTALDRHEPKLEKMVDTTQRLSQPIVKLYQKLMSRWVNNVDALGPTSFSPAVLAEVLHLLHSDGRYSREEHNRLRTDLEKVGQQSLLPRRGAEPPPLRRDELREELQTHQQRKDFLRFLLVVADYNSEIVDREKESLAQLATEEFGFSPQELGQLLAERRSRTLIHRL